MRIGPKCSPRAPLIYLAVALAVAVSLAAAGCGGDDEEEEAATAPTATEATETATEAAKAQTIELSETDFMLDPADPTVKPGTVVIEAANDGQVDHNIEVEGPTGEAELPEDLMPGESGKLEVDLSEPGKYTWFCPVANHRELGMAGTITVKG